MSQLVNYCANVASANVIGYYDRYFANLIPDYTPGISRGRRESPATSLKPLTRRGFSCRVQRASSFSHIFTGKTGSLTLILAAGAARKRLGHPYGRRNPTVAVRAHGFSHARAPLRASPREAGEPRNKFETGETGSLTLILAAWAARKRLGHPYGRHNPTVAVRAHGFSHARAPLRASPREAGEPRNKFEEAGEPRNKFDNL